MIASGDVQISVVAMLATLCLVVVAFMVLPGRGVAAVADDAHRAARRRKQEAPAVATADAGAGRLEQHCARAWRATAA